MGVQDSSRPKNWPRARELCPTTSDVGPDKLPLGATAGSLVPMANERLDHHQLEALRRGDLATAFGPPFDRVGDHGSPDLCPAGG